MKIVKKSVWNKIVEISRWEIYSEVNGDGYLTGCYRVRDLVNRKITMQIRNEILERLNESSQGTNSYASF